MIKMLFATIGYLFLILASVSLTVKDANVQRILLNKVAFFLIGIAMIFFTGNYLDVWKKLGIANIRYRWLQIIAIILIDVLILFGGVLILIIAERRYI